MTQRPFKQSVAYWCLADSEWEWAPDHICQVAKDLGLQSVELAPPSTYPILRKHNLACALCVNGMPGAPFMRGLNNLSYHEEIISRTREAVIQASEYGFPNVIAFTGYKWRNPDDPSGEEIPLGECKDNCITGLKILGSYAAERKVTICFEHLNTRDSSHPMKGHPGYQGDDIELCAEIVRQVNSPNVKLLFDFYHVQIMHGDLIRRLRAHRDLVGHIHTAGCPGRNELNDKQEIHYQGVAAALREIGYAGYIGHEFIPELEPRQSLKAAIEIFKSPA